MNCILEVRSRNISRSFDIMLYLLRKVLRDTADL